MWFRSLFLSADKPSRRRNARGATDRRLDARRLLPEPLEDRALLAFAAPTIYPVGSAYTLAAADFTGDGILDLTTQRGVLVGNGDGSFQSSQLSPYSGASLVAGDFDGDGKADLITRSDNTLNVLISNGNGTFQPAQPVTLPPQGSLPQQPLSALAGDLNSDGLLDLVATGATDEIIWIGPDAYGGYYAQNVRNTYVNVLVGTGAGTFTHAATNPLEGNVGPNLSSYGPDLGDFNGDGNLDLLTSYLFTYGLGWGSYDSSALSVRLGNGDGTFQAARTTSAAPGAHFDQHAVADFNQDGRTDVLMGGAEYATATVALGNADGTFTPLNPFDIGQTPSHDVVAREVGDVNGDGKIDLVFVKKLYENRWASVLLGKGDGTFGRPTNYDLSSITYVSPILADFNGDGSADLAAVGDVGVIVNMNAGGWSSNPPDLFIADVSAAEGNSGTKTMTFAVSLSRASGSAVSVNYATANGTATTSDNDYTAASGRLDFAPGETTKTITIVIRGDTRKESNEYFLVKLSGSIGATIADAQGEGTIANDDGGGKGNGKGNSSKTFASAVDAALDDWMTSPRKKRG